MKTDRVYQYGNILVTMLLVGLLAYILIFAVKLAAQELKLRQAREIDQYAADILGKCAKSSYAFACFDEELPKILDRLSFEKTFQVLSKVMAGKPQSDCHIAAHRIAEKEVLQNPQNWEETLRQCPDIRSAGYCSGGCIHGAMQGRFHKEVLSAKEISELLPNLIAVCSQKNIPAFQINCLHGLGHLLYEVTSADIPTSLNFCDMAIERMSTKQLSNSFTTACYAGIFMEFFRPDARNVIKPVEEVISAEKGALPFCQSFKESKRFSVCWKESWPVFKEGVSSPQGLVKFCSVLTSPEDQRYCYSATEFDLAIVFQFEKAKMVNFCSNMPRELISLCFSSMASSIMELTPNIMKEQGSLCAEAEKFGGGSECYERTLLLRYLETSPFPF